MEITPDDHKSRPRPGERLSQQLWLKALASGGRLPMPTIERVRAVKALVAAWEVEPETATEGPDA